MGSGTSSTDSGDTEVAIVVPGLLYGASSYAELCAEMNGRGYPTVVLPMEWWHWIPCLGGRSMRPVLERIDHAVEYVIAAGCASPVPAPSYTLWDLIVDFFNNPGGVLQVGGSSDPDSYPVVQPSGADFASSSSSLRAEASGPAARPRRRVALLGHSASGWISRIFLSDRPYGGRAYCGKRRVRALVTFGSPHAPAPGVAFESISWLSRAKERLEPEVRCLAVGGTGTLMGNATAFTVRAYEFCGASSDDAGVDGDGVTPLFSAHAFPDAEVLTLDALTHAPDYPALGPTAELAQERSDGKPWYGSTAAVERWLPWLNEASNEGGSDR